MMKKLKVKVIGTGAPEDPYRPELELGVTHKEGDIILSPIPTDPKTGKPLAEEVEIEIWG